MSFPILPGPIFILAPGYSALMIAERIGDTVETTLKTYSHLYPEKQIHLVNKLDELNNSTKLVPETPQEIKKP